MSFTVTGFLKEKHDAVQVTEKMLTRLFVIEKQGKHPELYAFQLINDRCDIIDAFEDGQEIEVSFNIKCRAWNDKYFTNLDAWKIQPTSVNKKAEPKNEPPAEGDWNAEVDPLPF